MEHTDQPASLENWLKPFKIDAKHRRPHHTHLGEVCEHYGRDHGLTVEQMPIKLRLKSSTVCSRQEVMQLTEVSRTGVGPCCFDAYRARSPLAVSAVSGQVSAQE